MSLIKKIKNILVSPIPFSIVVIMFFLILFHRFFPELFYFSLPEIIGTLIGAVLGFEIGAYFERMSQEKRELEKLNLEEKDKIKNRSIIANAIIEEMEDNLLLLNELKQLQYNQIPKEFLRISSWRSIQDNLKNIGDNVLLEKLHNLYYQIELTNKNIDYLRQLIFLTVPALDKHNRNLIFLRKEIVNSSHSISQFYADLKEDLTKLTALPKIPRGD